jgi:hypothetical protein
LIVKTLFGGFFVMIPHGFALYFRFLWNMILLFLAWWVVLFTGSFPKSWHEFSVGTLRWSLRGYGKGTSFTKLKGHRLHFLASNLKKKSDYYALERHNDYGTKD